MDDDVEAFPILAGMDGGYRGHDGIRRWWTSLLGTFPDFRAEIVEPRDLGDSTVAVLRFRGHGQVTLFRHGKCIGWHVFTSEREALELVGLAE
jgi:hypothetical protein